MREPRTCMVLVPCSSHLSSVEKAVYYAALRIVGLPRRGNGDTCFCQAPENPTHAYLVVSADVAVLVTAVTARHLEIDISDDSKCGVKAGP